MRLWNNLLKIFLPQDWPFSILFSTGHPQYTICSLLPCCHRASHYSWTWVLIELVQGIIYNLQHYLMDRKKKKKHSLILDRETLLEFYWHLKFSFDADIFTCGPTSLGEKTKATGGSFLGTGPDWLNKIESVLTGAYFFHPEISKTMSRSSSFLVDSHGFISSCCWIIKFGR